LSLFRRRDRIIFVLKTLVLRQRDRALRPAFMSACRVMQAVRVGYITPCRAKQAVKVFFSLKVETVSSIIGRAF
jgi:hypothetical protein